MSVANSYAKALFEAVCETKSPASAFESIESKIGAFCELLENSKDFSMALLGPLTTLQEKLTLIDTFAEKLEFPTLLVRFLGLLAKKGRLSELRKIQDEFNIVCLASQGGIAGQLISAEPMSESDIQVLAQSFTKKLGKRVSFRVSTDETLLAGMKVTVNGVTYDGTLRSQLQRLRDCFVTGISVGHS